MNKRIGYRSKSAKKFVNKGFPFKVKLFWLTIIALWLFKMIHFCCFSFSAHQSVYQQLLQIEQFEKQKKYASALEIHEKLIAQFPKYSEKHYLSIARCYLATSNTFCEFVKGMNYLLNKELTLQQVSELQDVVVFMDREKFLSMFSTYTYATSSSIGNFEKNCNKIYVLEP